MAVFDPFMMGGMLLFKIALPLLLVASTSAQVDPEAEAEAVRAELRAMQPEIDKAIDKGVEFLLSKQLADGTWNFQAGAYGAVMGSSLLRSG